MSEALQLAAAVLMWPADSVYFITRANGTDQAGTIACPDADNVACTTL